MEVIDEFLFSTTDLIQTTSSLKHILNCKPLGATCSADKLGGKGRILAILLNDEPDMHESWHGVWVCNPFSVSHYKFTDGEYLI